MDNTTRNLLAYLVVAIALLGMILWALGHLAMVGGIW